MRVLGIDPGLDGALALYADGALVEVFDMPTVDVIRNKKQRREVSGAGVADMIEALKPDKAYLEQVNSRTGEAAVAAFTFGRGYGVVEGVLAACRVPITPVPPVRWVRAVGVRGGKDNARARAIEVFPSWSAKFARKKDDGRADAALIAKYGGDLEGR